MGYLNLIRKQMALADIPIVDRPLYEYFKPDYRDEEWFKEFLALTYKFEELRDKNDKDTSRVSDVQSFFQYIDANPENNDWYQRQVVEMLEDERKLNDYEEQIRLTYAFLNGNANRDLYRVISNRYNMEEYPYLYFAYWYGALSGLTLNDFYAMDKESGFLTRSTMPLHERLFFFNIVLNNVKMPNDIQTANKYIEILRYYSRYFLERKAMSGGRNADLFDSILYKIVTVWRNIIEAAY